MSARTWQAACTCNGNCVEVAHELGRILVRSSLQPNKVVEFTGEEWSTFLQAVKSGEFG